MGLPWKNIISASNKLGSYPILAGGRYTNLATAVTSSGFPFSGSISPTGELFRIYIDTSANSAITSSYLTDIRISKFDPSELMPFSEIHSTSSAVFQNWYNEQYDSASAFDRDNIHSIENNLPLYIQESSEYDDLKKFTSMTGEQYDIIRNHIIENYNRIKFLEWI